MRKACNQFYGHFVWATWDRLPLLIPEVRSQVYEAIQIKCEALRCPVHAIGGVEDHIHLVELAGPVSQSQLAKEVKGASSHLMNHEIRPDYFFRWQGSYGSFSFAPKDMDRIIHYVENQEEHHRNNRLMLSLELPDPSDAPNER